MVEACIILCDRRTVCRHDVCPAIVVFVYLSHQVWTIVDHAVGGFRLCELAELSSEFGSFLYGEFCRSWRHYRFSLLGPKFGRVVQRDMVYDIGRAIL